MFANPIWSLLLLAAPLALYWFVIRPKAPILETRKYVSGFFERWWARIVAFRTWVVGFVAALMIALPDLLVLIPGLDLSFLPHPWPMYVTSASSILLVVMRAFSTTANERPEG